MEIFQILVFINASKYATSAQSRRMARLYDDIMVANNTLRSQSITNYCVRDEVHRSRR